MENKKGISLVVLVITIIVMIIIAGIVILSLSNSGIIPKSKNVVKDTNIIQVQELANNIWMTAYSDETIVTDGEYEQYVKEKLILSGVKVEDFEINVTTEGVIVQWKEDVTVDD